MRSSINPLCAQVMSDLMMDELELIVAGREGVKAVKGETECCCIAD